MTWREISFTYRVPDGIEADQLESEMADCLALFAGCDHGDQDEDEECAGDWVFTSRPVNMDCGCMNEECACGCGSFACGCPTDCPECT